MKAKNVMKDEILPTVRKDASIKFVINETTRGKLDNVLSVDQNGVSVGILSDDDLCRALMRDDFDINDPALKYATKNPKTIGNKIC